MRAVQIALLGGLGVAGFLVYRRYIRGGAVAATAAALEVSAPEMTAEAAQDVYEQTTVDHAAWLAGSRRSDGSMMFQPRVPLSVVKEKLLYPYVALVRETTRNNAELAQERGDPLPGSVYITQPGKSNPYLVKHRIARIYLFNAGTGSEVALWELKKNSAVWLPDMAAALESWYANAFNYACRISPGYDQFNNSIALNTQGKQVSVNCDVKYNIAL